MSEESGTRAEGQTLPGHRRHRHRCLLRQQDHPRRNLRRRRRRDLRHRRHRSGARTVRTYPWRFWPVDDHPGWAKTRPSHRFENGTLLEWIRDRAAPLFPHVFVVAKDPSRFHDLGLPIVNDALPEGGSAVGVYTAVLAAPTERVLCLACDMPFVTPRLLWQLAEQSVGFDVFRAPARGLPPAFVRRL